MAEPSSHPCFQQPPPPCACGEHALHDADHTELAYSYEGFAEPHVESAEENADFEALKGGPHGKSADSNVDHRAQDAYPNAGDLHEDSADPDGDCGHFAHPNGRFADPNEELRADPYGESADLSEESADPRGDYRDFEHPNGDPADPYADDEDSAYPDGGFVYPCEESEDTHGGLEDSDGDDADSDEDFVDPDIIRTAHLTRISKPSLSRCSSASSIVTHAASESSSGPDQLDMNSESLETHWTNEKHKSYLNFMEANFVKNLYHTEYCAVDVCGQAPCHLESNSAQSHSRLPEFKSWQNGDWQWRSMPKPLTSACIPWDLLRNPWVNHFRHPAVAYATGQLKNARSFPDMEEGEEVDSPLEKILQVVPPVVQERISCHQSASSSNMSLKENESSSELHGKNVDAETDTLKQQVLQAVCHKISNFASSSNTRKRALQPDSEQRPCTHDKIQTIGTGMAMQKLQCDMVGKRDCSSLI